MSRSVSGCVGKRSLYEETEFDWKIDISNNTEELHCEMLYCESPIFVFRKVDWHFALHREPGINKSMLLRLVCSGILEYPVEYTIGLVTVNNNVEELDAGVLRRKYSEYCFIDGLEVFQRKNELAPSDVLTVTCTLKCNTILPSKRKLISNPEPRKLIKLENLSEDFWCLFCDKNSCDITLNVMERECKAHKTILMARSPVFAAMFRHNTTEKQTGVVNIPDCDPESFEKFLEFLYAGELEELSESDALNLYATSEKYQVQDLKTFCSEYLTEHFTVDNFCDIVIIADRYVDAKLLSEAQMFFNNNMNQIQMTSEWDNLSKNYPILAKNLLKMSTKVAIVKQ